MMRDYSRVTADPPEWYWPDPVEVPCPFCGIPVEAELDPTYPWECPYCGAKEPELEEGW